MMDTTNGRVLMIPRFERVPWLVHGFGTGKWSEEDFAKNEEWEDFCLVILDQVHSDTVHRLEGLRSGSFGATRSSPAGRVIS